MNEFTNAVVKSNGKFEAWQEDERRQRKNEKGRLEFVEGDWINLLEDYSAKKREVAVDTVTTGNMIRAAHKSESYNGHEAGSSRTIFQSTRRPREISNLEIIIRNFEKGYLSPSKKERAIDEYKQKNFVKKIVEAFEVKYNIYNDSKTEQISESLEVNKSNAAPMLESWKRRSGILCNPFKTGSLSSKPDNRDVDECDGGVLSSEQRIFHTSQDNSRLIRRRLRELGNSKRLSESKMVLSAFGRKASGLELCSTFLHSGSDSDSSSPPNCFTRAELMRKIELSDSMKRFSPDETKTTNRVDIYIASSEENIFTPNDSLPTTSTLIDESLKSQHNSTSEISHVDKSPKVVGAFLKKPINVENTFIDWVPVIGKRLPRKRSLKKLLCSLTTGKLVKRFSSERNLSEEPREFQDSDDERSYSSLSLTSLISIADVLRYQENIYYESNGKSGLKTFKSNEELCEVLSDTYLSAEKQKRKQLLLTEVPREAVNLDLGPSYPPPFSQTTRLLSPLVGERLVPKLPDDPRVSKIPKNPFVASIKIDNLAKFNSCRVCRDGNVSSSVIIKNDLYEVEFQRSCNDLPSSNVRGSSSSVTSHYDVPRRFLSKSENEILWMWKSKSMLNRKEEPIYDIPKSRSIERPRCSIYDDSESHRAIDARIYMNSQVQLSSSNHLVSDV